MLIVILAVVGSVAVGYLTLLLLSALGAPLPPIAKLPLPPEVRGSVPPSTTDETDQPAETDQPDGSESPTTGSGTPATGTSPDATSPIGAAPPR